jgi:hypothetical protein
MREAVTRQTVRHLAEAERDPWDLPIGPLCVVLGTNAFPLVPVRSNGAERYSQRKELALQAADAVPSEKWVDRGFRGHSVVVALLSPEDDTVHFMNVSRNARDRRRIDSLTIFDRRPAPEIPFEPGVFTD